MRRLLPLAFIEVFVWLMLLLGAFLVSRIVFEISFGTPNLFLTLITDGVRISLSAAVLYGWLIAWKRITSYYFWHTIERNSTA
jgi:hypothetical protein